MINNVVIVSGVQQSDSVICIHVSIKGLTFESNNQGVYTGHLLGARRGNSLFTVISKYLNKRKAGIGWGVGKRRCSY